MGQKGRASNIDGKDGDEHDQLMCGVFQRERQSSTELRRRLGVDAIGCVMRRGRLRWHEHVERKDDADCNLKHVQTVVEKKN